MMVGESIHDPLHSPLSRPRHPLRRSAIRRLTKRRVVEQREWREVFRTRREECGIGSVCEAMIFQVCEGESTIGHHICGRGPGLNTVENCLCVCKNCHAWIHAHPAESYRRGWMAKRNWKETP